MDKIKINFEDPNFFVNKEKKTITCKLFGSIDKPKGMYHVWEDSFNVTCTAKCSPDDEFDMEKGKRIALAKAENKIFEKAGKSLKELENELSHSLLLIGHYAVNSNNYIAHNNRYIQSIGNGSIPVKPLKKGTVTFSEKNKKK